MTRDEVIEFAKDMADIGVSTRDVRIITRAADEALRDLAQRYFWPEYRTWHRLNVRSSNSTGTVTLDSDRVTVTGVGVTFDADIVDQLFVAGSDQVTHEIETRTSSSILVLKTQYQTVDGTTFSGGSTFKIFYYSFVMPNATGSPFITRNVEAVLSNDHADEVKKISEADMRALWASSIEEDRPHFYSLIREAKPTDDGSEQLRLLFWPGTGDTYPVDILLDRWPNTFPASDSGSTHIDVRDRMLEPYKALLISRLSQFNAAWAKRKQVALAEANRLVAQAKREAVGNQGSYRIGDGGISRATARRRWTLTEAP